MTWRALPKRVAYWTIPPGLQDVIRTTVQGSHGVTLSDRYTFHAQKRALLQRNKRFLSKHTRQRCFVLATGPSIREQDLRPLQNEWCIAVSEFYRHQHYSLIKPAYYAFAPNHHPFTADDMLRELTEMKQHAQDEIFFFAMNDKALVKHSNLVDNWERVHYIDFFGDLTRARIDLTARVPMPYGAAIMATWIAMYMGFSEIYLVGCDHNHLWKWDGLTPFTRENYYQHFYDGAPTTGYQPMDVDGQLISTLKARQYYRWTNEVALRQGTRIFNANPSGYLDVVPRVSLATLFQ